jgi:transglutaminase-like putative cysteine protease
LDEKEVIEELDERFEESHEKKSPIKYIVSIFLILLIVLMSIPYYSIKLDPHPKEIPTLNDILKNDIELSSNTIQITKREDYRKALFPSDPNIKLIASKIIQEACPKEKRICHAKALYFFVRNNFNYISDPIGIEYVEEPTLFLNSGGGDCESGTIFLANLMESIGIDTQMVFVPGHAFLRIRLPEALSVYKDKEGWVYLDWTCERCGFGKLPKKYEAMTFMDV